MCNGLLCVKDGDVRIDGSDINVVGKEKGKDLHLRGVYVAVNNDTKLPWMGWRPPLDGKWTVSSCVFGVGDRPCLFMSVRLFLMMFL